MWSSNDDELNSARRAVLVYKDWLWCVKTRLELPAFLEEVGNYEDQVEVCSVVIAPTSRLLFLLPEISSEGREQTEKCSRGCWIAECLESILHKFIKCFPHLL